VKGKYPKIILLSHIESTVNIVKIVQFQKEPLIVSFGHEKELLQGATVPRRLFEWTIFLDEVGELPTN
jgi:transcriptional regulator with AAA-type ATPase domain